ncbi:MAG TPA: DUF4149 domain-containing protein [Burkholderiaceae bacterium]|nr:DUF4149 domain-containing protein [Burkholderiaceae bacterium]
MSSEAAIRRLNALRLVVLAAWCGLTWTIGYAVAPQLFTALNDPALAGMLAGRLFRIQAYATLVVAPLLWLSFTGAWSARDAGRRIDARLVLAMLALTLVGYFGLQPLMADVRAAIAQQGRTPELVSRFAWLHGISAAFYLAHSLVGVWLVVRQARVAH